MQNPEPQVQSDPQARSDELTMLAEKLAADAAALPGRGAEEHRQLMHRVFEDLAQILPLLEGPEPGGAARLRMRAVEAARADLARPSDLSPEPAVSRGLRGAYDALAAVQRDSYFEQAQLGETLDRLRAVVGELDELSGSPHRAAATEAVELISRAVGGMADVLAGRIAEEAANHGASGAGATDAGPEAATPEDGPGTTTEGDASE